MGMTTPSPKYRPALLAPPWITWGGCSQLPSFRATSGGEVDLRERHGLPDDPHSPEAMSAETVYHDANGDMSELLATSEMHGESP